MGKCILACLSSVLVAVGSAFVSVGLWLQKNADTFDGQKSFPFSMFVTILIVQGVVMGIAGTGEVYSVWQGKRGHLKKFCFFLAVLALVDVIIGVSLYFKLKEFGNTLVDLYTTGYEKIQEGEKDLNVTLPFGLMQILPCCGIPGNDTICHEMKKPGLPDCPWLISIFFSIAAPVVMVIFLGTTVLLISTMGFTINFLKQTEGGNREDSAHY